MSDSRPHVGDAAALRRARDEIGRAVGELGHRRDVAARIVATRIKEKAHDDVEATKHAASEAAHAVAGTAAQVRTSAEDLAHRVATAPPVPAVFTRGKHAAETLRAHPIPAALAAVTAAVLVWRIMRRRR
ncbi:hypothetical protein [Nocardia sp. R6R-6]|uniref:hypothetical protein n=1 Tax=Nocardia sp. R6R-6 TaxID=3459303 RepID=UPI00403DFF3E